MDFKMFISLPDHYKPKAFYFPGEIKTVPQENIFPVTFPTPHYCQISSQRREEFMNAQLTLIT